MNYMGLTTNTKPSSTSHCTYNKSLWPRRPLLEALFCFFSLILYCPLIPPLVFQDPATLVPFQLPDVPNSFLSPVLMHGIPILFSSLCPPLFLRPQLKCDFFRTSTEYLNLKYVLMPPCSIIFSPSTLFFFFTGLFTNFNCIFRYSIMPISTTTL